MASHSNNLLVIMSDEHQAGVMGCAGHEFIQTPNLDRLAQGGTRFTQAYTPSPICVPARASFATGLYAHQTRLWDNAMPYTGQIPGWGHALQNLGVRVESIGKLHYRDTRDPNGFDQEHIPMMVVGGVGMVWASIRREGERISGPKRMLGDYIGPGESNYTRYDRSVTERTIQWLTEQSHNNNDHPWCLFVGLVAPHFPLVVPEEFFSLYPESILPDLKCHPKDGYQRHPWIEKQNAFMDSESKFRDWSERRAAESAYYGLVSWMDHNLGQIVGALGELGLESDTTIIYTSDHGDNIGARGLWGKSNLYQEAAGVPMIISTPEARLEKPTRETHTPVSLIDLAPTIAEHFGTTLTAPHRGRSLYEIESETTDKDRVIFSEYHAAGAVTGAFMVRQGDYKYIYYVGFEPELFDLAQDPEEITNLAEKPEHQETQKRLHETLMSICDPEATDALAHADQSALIERHGGREAALKLGAPGATPPPET